MLNDTLPKEFAAKTSLPHLAMLRVWVIIEISYKTPNPLYIHTSRIVKLYESNSASSEGKRRCIINRKGNSCSSQIFPNHK